MRKVVPKWYEWLRITLLCSSSALRTRSFWPSLNSKAIFDREANKVITLKSRYWQTESRLLQFVVNHPRKIRRFIRVEDYTLTQTTEKKKNKKNVITLIRTTEAILIDIQFSSPVLHQQYMFVLGLHFSQKTQKIILRLVIFYELSLESGQKSCYYWYEFNTKRNSNFTK